MTISISNIYVVGLTFTVVDGVKSLYHLLWDGYLIEVLSRKNVFSIET